MRSPQWDAKQVLVVLRNRQIGLVDTHPEQEVTVDDQGWTLGYTIQSIEAWHCSWTLIDEWFMISMAGCTTLGSAAGTEDRPLRTTQSTFHHVLATASATM